jgi:hypothetical protein
MHIKSTLESVSPMMTKFKPPIASIARLALMASPMGIASGVAVIGGGIAVKEIYDHRAEIKSTLGNVESSIKKKSVDVTNTIEKTGDKAVKAVGKAANSVGSGIEKLLMPVMVIGSLVVVMMILKK